MTVCSIDGCDRPLVARGWCSQHYQRWRYHGDPLGGGRYKTVGHRVNTLDRLWSKVDDSAGPNGCWPWIGTIDRHGYGAFNLGGLMVRAHRMVYEVTVGLIPAGLELDHLCRTPICVNPAHLEPVTHAENMRRRDLARPTPAPKTHCIHGHELTAENTYVYPSGRISCRPCSSEATRRSRARKKIIPRSARAGLPPASSRARGEAVVSVLAHVEASCPASPRSFDHGPEASQPRHAHVSGPRVIP